MHCKCYFKRYGEVGPHNQQVALGLCTGVTLAELLVTLAILCILAAIALPGLSAFSSRKSIIHQADEMVGCIHQVRENAMREGIYWKIIFKPENQQWYCFGDANRNGKCDSGETQLGPYKSLPGITFGCHAPKGPNNSAIPSDGVSFDDNRLSFSPLGGCNAGTVYLSSIDRSMALRVLPASGTVLIYEWISSWRMLR